MQGEIIIAEALRHEASIRDWQHRQELRLEWMALEEWWGLLRRMREATSTAERRQVASEQKQLTERYGPQLRRALTKWAQAKEEQYRLAQRSGGPQTTPSPAL